MGNRVDRELAQSRQGPEIKTDAARQAHYIKWADILGIPDPCGPYPGYQRIVAIYIKYVQCGPFWYGKRICRVGEYPLQIAKYAGTGGSIRP
jgi:hypothetical protein